MKAATAYAVERGFVVRDKDCGATATFSQFGSLHGEVVRPGWVPFTVSRSGTWSAEGLLTVRRAGAVEADLEDESVSLRGYSTAKDLMNDLAWKLVRPFTWLYSPAGG